MKAAGILAQLRRIKAIEIDEPKYRITEIGIKMIEQPIQPSAVATEPQVTKTEPEIVTTEIGTRAFGWKETKKQKKHKTKTKPESKENVQS